VIKVRIRSCTAPTSPAVRASRPCTNPTEGAAPVIERVSPRVFRVVALPAPSAREKSQMYIRRYVPHLPAAGEVIIFDRSWYNRAGVERVMGFCTLDEVARFLEIAPAFEKAMIDSGIILIKHWLEVSPDEQTRRLKSRINDPPQDLEAN
jgi:polyphosphate kinase